MGNSLNWDGHRYLALITTNCWCSRYLPEDIGWNHKDDSVVCSRPFCRGVWDGAVLPDNEELWKECRQKLQMKFYMTPDCPPPPPYHHRPEILKAVLYYMDLARQKALQNDAYEAGRLFGIFTHFSADFIIEPYIAQQSADGSVKMVWDYHLRADPMSDAVLKIPQSAVRPEQIVPLKVPTPHDYVVSRLWEARRLGTEGMYEEAVAVLVTAVKTVHYALQYGWYDSFDKLTLDAMIANLALYFAGVYAHIRTENPLYLAMSALGALGSAPALSYYRFGRKLWYGRAEGV